MAINESISFRPFGWESRRRGWLWNNVPNTAVLFVGPVECARHRCSHIADMEHVYMLCPPDEETSIGSTESIVCDAVGEILDELGDWAKGIIIFTGCQTRFAGLDFAGLLRAVERRYPIIAAHYEESDFPETDGYNPARQSPFESVLRLLPPNNESGALRDGILLLNNGFSFEKSNELSALVSQRLFAAGGWNDWDELAAIGHASISLVTSEYMLPTARMLEQRQGIPYLSLPLDYRLEGIADAYKTLSDRIGTVIDCSKAMETVKIEIERALRSVGGRPLSLQLSGSERPWNLTRALCENGFKVESVSASEFELSDDVTQYDDADLRWIAESHPDITLQQEEREGIHGFRGRGDRHEHGGFGGDIGHGQSGGEGRHGFQDEGRHGHGGEDRHGYKGDGRHGHGDGYGFGGSFGGHGGNGFDTGLEETALWGYAALGSLMKQITDAAQGLETEGRRR